VHSGTTLTDTCLRAKSRYLPMGLRARMKNSQAADLVQVLTDHDPYHDLVRDKLVGESPIHMIKCIVDIVY
jgi:hypothetical protein